MFFQKCTWKALTPFSATKGQDREKTWQEIKQTGLLSPIIKKLECQAEKGLGFYSIAGRDII